MMKMETLMHKAQLYCEKHQYRWTEPRERVLRVLANFSSPLGAYEIVSELSSEDRKVKAPSVYRALEFWLEQGFIHKVDSENKFMLCSNHDCDGSFFIFVCQACSRIVETCSKSISKTVFEHGKQMHFNINSINMEVRGVCVDCHNAAV